MCSDNKRHHGAQALEEIKRLPRQACALQMFMACLALARIFTLLSAIPVPFETGGYKSALSEEPLMACDKSRVSNHYLLPLLKFPVPPLCRCLCCWDGTARGAVKAPRWRADGCNESWQEEGHCHALIRDSWGRGTGRDCGDAVLRGDKSGITDREGISLLLRGPSCSCK